MKNNQKGITLIALIITIIIMLILVAVTINVALNGGLFTRAREATMKTEIQQIKEQLLIEKATQMADNEINGTTGYSISIDDLDISSELKNKYRNKLIISPDGDLKYNEENMTEEEKTYMESIGIESALNEKPEVVEEPNNPLIGKVFIAPGFEIQVMKDIKSDNTLKFINMDNLEYLDGTYTYDPSTKEFNPYLNGELLDGSPYHYFKIGSTSGLYGTDDYFSLFITDSGESLSLLNGYTITSDDKTITFGEHNHATVVIGEYNDDDIYYVVDDGTIDSGEFPMMFGLTMYTITKVDGVYTQMVPIANGEATYTLIPPQD